MVMVVIVVMVLMRFMDVVCSVIIICLCCMPILVKVSACSSQFIFIFRPVADIPGCATTDVIFNLLGSFSSYIAVTLTIKKHYDSDLLGEFFFDIVQQTMQHCGVALFQKAKTLIEPVGHFNVIRYA